MASLRLPVMHLLKAEPILRVQNLLQHLPHPHQEPIHQLHPPILQPHSPSNLIPPPRRPSPADLTGSQTMLPLPRVRPVPPDRPRQTFNEPRLNMHSRTDIDLVGVLLAIQGHEPGNKGNRKVRDNLDIWTAMYLADGAGKEVVDATVAQVEQHVHRLEGTLCQGQGVELKAPTIDTRCMRGPLWCNGERGRAQHPSWCPHEVVADGGRRGHQVQGDSWSHPGVGADRHGRGR